MSIAITPEEVKAYTSTGSHVQFLDARSADAFNASSEKIPGAIRVPADGEALPSLNEGQLTVAYCT